MNLSVEAKIRKIIRDFTRIKWSDKPHIYYLYSVSFCISFQLAFYRQTNKIHIRCRLFTIQTK